MAAPTTDDAEKARERAVKALGEPVFLRSDPEVHKTRMRMLVVALIAIFVVWFDLRIKHDSIILGVNVENFGDEPLRVGLLVLNIYLLAHFLWQSWDDFAGWRLHITGSNALQHMMAVTDTPRHDPRNSTLNNWWRESAARIGDLKQELENIKHKLLPGGNTASHELQRAITTLDSHLAEAVRSFSVKRPEASLERFDKWFLNFRRSQELRWFFFDALLPTLVSLVAIALLVGAMVGFKFHDAGERQAPSAEVFHGERYPGDRRLPAGFY